MPALQAHHVLTAEHTSTELCTVVWTISGQEPLDYQGNGELFRIIDVSKYLEVLKYGGSN